MLPCPYYFFLSSWKFGIIRNQNKHIHAIDTIVNLKTKQLLQRVRCYISLGDQLHFASVPENHGGRNCEHVSPKYNLFLNLYYSSAESRNGTEQEWNGTGRAPRVKLVFEESTSFPVVK